ncbi:MAG: LytR C-terminal domain-containing protein [Candidatus Levyibacteriota bacterium]
MKRKSKTVETNFKIATIFIVVILFFIFISFLLKLILLFQNSKFDGEHRFTVSVIKENDTKVLSFSPQNKTISLLSIKGEVENIDSFLKIPIDASIESKKLSFSSNNIAIGFLKTMLGLNGRYSGITSIDLLRLSYFARSLPLTSVYEKKVSNTDDELKRSSVLYSFFTDQEILNEKKRVQVINGTDVSGVGGKLASVVNNMGGDVVLVLSADKEEENSKIIYFGEKSYTVKRLSSVLNYPVEKAREKSIADVIIVIGKDKIAEFKY